MTIYLSTIIGILFLIVIVLLVSPPPVEHSVIVHPMKPSADITRGYSL